MQAAWSQALGADGQTGIYHARSTDQGRTWSKAKNASRLLGVASDPDNHVGPKGEVFVVWTHTKKGDDHPEHSDCARSADDGATWDPAIDATSGFTYAAHPSATVDSKSVLHLAWEESAAGVVRSDIFTTASWDNGQTFDVPLDVAPTQGLSTQAAIATGEGRTTRRRLERHDPCGRGLPMSGSLDPWTEAVLSRRPSTSQSPRASRTDRVSWSLETGSKSSGRSSRVAGRT